MLRVIKRKRLLPQILKSLVSNDIELTYCFYLLNTFNNSFDREQSNVVERRVGFESQLTSVGKETRGELPTGS